MLKMFVKYYTNLKDAEDYVTWLKSNTNAFVVSTLTKIDYLNIDGEERRFFGVHVKLIMKEDGDE